MVLIRAHRAVEGMDDFVLMDNVVGGPDEDLYRRAIRDGLVRFWRNSRYQVIETPMQKLRDDVPDLVWLSIKRIDRQPIHDWRDLQRIKNALVGRENEGVELYPAESRLVDTSNQYHLWVFADTDFRFPFGYQEREVSDADEAAKVGAVQRPFARGSEPAGTSGKKRRPPL